MPGSAANSKNEIANVAAAELRADEAVTLALDLLSSGDLFPEICERDFFYGLPRVRRNKRSFRRPELKPKSGLEAS